MTALKAGGYDIVFEAHERLFNRLIAAYYYMGKFPRMKGSYTLPIKKIPPDLIDFVTVIYDVKFGLPSLDFIALNNIKIFLSSTANIIVFGGLEIKLELSFSVTTSTKYDKNSRLLTLDFKNPRIDVEINDKTISPNVLDKLNEILAFAFREYLHKDIGTIDLAPFVRYTPLIPGAGKAFALEFRDCKITNNIMALAVNCLDYPGGKISEVKNFTGGNDLAVAISENAIRRTFDYWWKHAKIETQFRDRKTLFDINLDKIGGLDLFRDLSGGLFSSFLIRFDGFSLAFDYTVSFDKPDLNIRHKNKITLRGKAKLHFSLVVNMHYKVRKIKKFKIRWKRYTKKILSWSDDAVISYFGQAQILLDGKGNLKADLNWLRVIIDVDDFPKILDVFLTVLANFAAEEIIKRYPPIELGSIPLLHKAPGTQLTLGFAPVLQTYDQEVFVRTPVNIYGLENYPPAPFIANCNPSCKELHKAECQWVKFMLEKHKRPYYWIEEAHRDGYDNCHYCLGDSKR